MKKILSVSIAAYNVEEYLEETLNSFIIQEDMDKIEVIIVNDGSKDGTLKIAKAYASKYPETFKVIDKKNGGWGSTVNAAIREATGKYFKLLDGDDYFLKKNLNNFLNVLDKCGTDMVVNPYSTFTEKDNNICEYNLGKEYEKGKKILFTELNEKFPLAMHALTFKTSVLKDNNVNITENCFYTDIEYIIKSCEHVKDCTFYDFNIYCYRIARAGQSVSKEGISRHYKEHLKVLDELYKYYDNSKADPKSKQILKNRIYAMTRAQYENFFLLQNKKKELIQFDYKLRTTNFYNCGGKLIQILRLSKFILYPLICRYFCKKHNA